ncbi:alpha/beta hydrolase [Streptosporangium canum]|uniref:alpha/beta hydrolase n=1 Tax=Streptosporangium canum TaxID=324952 RepID=UPI00369F2AD7
MRPHEHAGRRGRAPGPPRLRADAAWLEEGVLLREAHRLAGIPGVLIHGRFDLGSPLENAWQLAQAWPDARLVVVDDSGHTGSPTMAKAVPAALDGFAG